MNTAVIFGYYVAAYALCLLVSAIIIGLIMNRLMKTPADDEILQAERKFLSIARITGSLEQVMHISAILLGWPQFIGVWLVVKALDLYKRSSRVFSIYLIGTSLSLIFAVGTALCIQQLLPAFPSLSQWRLPSPLGWLRVPCLDGYALVTSGSTSLYSVERP